jgi:uncharacterized protein with NAD-binding domain and iron-sulfur cluster
MNELNNNISKCINTIDIEDLITKKPGQNICWSEAVQMLDPIVHKEVAYLDSIGRKFASKQYAKAWATMIRGV